MNNDDESPYDNYYFQRRILYFDIICLDCVHPGIFHFDPAGRHSYFYYVLFKSDRSSRNKQTSQQ